MTRGKSIAVLCINIAILAVIAWATITLFEKNRAASPNSTCGEKKEFDFNLKISEDMKSAFVAINAQNFKLAQDATNKVKKIEFRNVPMAIQNAIEEVESEKGR